MGGTGLERAPLVAFPARDKSSRPPLTPSRRENAVNSLCFHLTTRISRRTLPSGIIPVREFASDECVRSLQYPHLLRRRHGDKPMFPVPRVLKEPSYPKEVMTKCFRSHADRWKYHSRCRTLRAKTVLPFNSMLEPRDVWHQKFVGKDRAKFKCSLWKSSWERTRSVHSIPSSFCTGRIALTVCLSINMPYFFISRANQRQKYRVCDLLTDGYKNCSTGNMLTEWFWNGVTKFPHFSIDLKSISSAVVSRIIYSNNKSFLAQVQVLSAPKLRQGNNSNVGTVVMRNVRARYFRTILG